MKYHFKVGDWVKHPDWDKFYPVKEIRVNGFTLLMNYFTDLRWEGDAIMFEVKEKEQPMKIDMNKKYRKVGTHEPVRVICVDRATKQNTIPVLALVKSKNGVELLFHLNEKGCNDRTREQIIEEIPAVDWSKVEIDTPIIVTDIQGYKRNVHFAGVIGGKICYYPDGRTSHSYRGVIAGGLSVLPHEAKLAEE